MKTLSITTSQGEEFVNITDAVREVVRDAACTDGACVVFCPHTTAGLTINECADPDVVRDMLVALADSVPEERPWRHGEGNAPAHVKASLVGSSVTIPVHDGRLSLGTWQGVFLCEFDGPRTRGVKVQILS